MSQAQLHSTLALPFVRCTQHEVLDRSLNCILPSTYCGELLKLLTQLLPSIQECHEDVQTALSNRCRQTWVSEHCLHGHIVGFSVREQQGGFFHAPVVRLQHQRDVLAEPQSRPTVCARHLQCNFCHILELGRRLSAPVLRSSPRTACRLIVQCDQVQMSQLPCNFLQLQGQRLLSSTRILLVQHALHLKACLADGVDQHTESQTSHPMELPHLRLACVLASCKYSVTCSLNLDLGALAGQAHCTPCTKAQACHNTIPRQKLGQRCYVSTVVRNDATEEERSPCWAALHKPLGASLHLIRAPVRHIAMHDAPCQIVTKCNTPLHEADPVVHAPSTTR